MINLQLLKQEIGEGPHSTVKGAVHISTTVHKFPVLNCVGFVPLS